MIRTKYEQIRRNGNVSVEMNAEFEEDITHKFYSHNEIYKFFSRYKFTNFVDDFREAYNCQVRCHSKYYLYILSETSCLFFGKFLVSTMDIVDRGEPTFLAIPSFDDRGNPIQEINSILQHELYKQVKVCVAMEIKFLLFSSLDELTVYERSEQHMGRPLTDYEREQLEDLEGGSDADYDSDDDETPKPVKSPFVTDKCCICLTEKPEIVLVPCLHKSVCLQCEEKGKLTKCPTCRRMITKKIKI